MRVSPCCLVTQFHPVVDFHIAIDEVDEVQMEEAANIIVGELSCAPHLRSVLAPKNFVAFNRRIGEILEQNKHVQFVRIGESAHEQTIKVL